MYLKLVTPVYLPFIILIYFALLSCLSQVQPLLISLNYSSCVFLYPILSYPILPSRVQSSPDRATLKECSAVRFSPAVLPFSSSSKGLVFICSSVPSFLRFLKKKARFRFRFCGLFLRFVLRGYIFQRPLSLIVTVASKSGVKAK